jgi:Josephin
MCCMGVHSLNCCLGMCAMRVCALVLCALAQGFVCNRQAHWIAIRRVHDRYWDLNSMLDRPTPITSYALEATLHQVTDR